MKKYTFALPLIIVIIFFSNSLYAQINAQEKLTFGSLSFSYSTLSLSVTKIIEEPTLANSKILSVTPYFPARVLVIKDKNGKTVYASGAIVYAADKIINYTPTDSYSDGFASRQNCPCSDLSDINDLKGGTISVFLTTIPSQENYKFNTDGGTLMDADIVGTAQPVIAVKNKTSGAVVLNFTSPKLTFKKAEIGGAFVASGTINF